MSEPDKDNGMTNGPDSRPFQPDWTLHPGVTLAELLTERGITPVQLAADTGLPVEVIEGILGFTVAIDEPAAERLHAGLGVSAAFWLNYQRNYEDGLARGAKDVSRPARASRAAGDQRVPHGD